ncbi:cAMP-dependent protein kinase [Aureococcus anophagefferens]|uniref:cAMP-dependent protein kinase n=1 Tax=Aureococcus anophagefferens TaxID=44056 RepID=A0ABR1FIL1_AURAN
MARVLEKISTDRPSLGDAALDKYKESADWPSPTGVEAANDPGAGSSFWGAVGGWARGAGAPPSETLSVTVETEDGSTCVSSSDRDEVSVATANPEPDDVDGAPESFACMDVGDTIGVGSFSRVKIAVVRPSADSDEGARVCAIKVCHKARILEADEVVSILREKDALTVVKHPFVMELFGTHQDADRCYFVCEYIPGGELFTYIHNVCSGSMADVDAQFYAACVADAFEHAHGLGVINRDAKPENIVIDAYGYPKLCDWGFAKTDVKRGDACLTICGTLEYLSREVLLNLGYAFDVDLWTLGVLIFEMIAGRTPFYDPLMADNLQQQSIYDNILHGDVVLPNWDVPDVVLKLLDVDVHRRLGADGGAAQVKRDAFFDDVNFDALRRRELIAPWTPMLQSETDITHFQDQGVDLDEDDADADLLFHGDDSLFADF